MDWLNYHHLYYFWMVAKEGGLSRAAEQLHLSQPTLSSQIKTLEKSFGTELFTRSGRTLALTESGQMIYRYADEIFSLGRELLNAAKSGPANRLRLTVGVPDVLPKLIVYRLLQPALRMPEQVQLVCYEGKLPTLLADLALHRLDLVLADSPLSPQDNVRAFNHLLGKCGISILGVKSLATQYKHNFPNSLEAAPMLLPTQNSTLRRTLEQWFDEQDIHPICVHEFEDSAILKVFGQAGEGLFAVPTAIEADVIRQYALQRVGRISSIQERFYAISVERRLKHPAVLAISQAARGELFGKPAAEVSRRRGKLE